MESKGLGDTVHKAAKLVGADKVAKVYEKVTGNLAVVKNEEIL